MCTALLKESILLTLYTHTAVFVWIKPMQTILMLMHLHSHTTRGAEGQTGLIVSSSRSREHIDFSHTPLSTHLPLARLSPLFYSRLPKHPSYFSPTPPCFSQTNLFPSQSFLCHTSHFLFLFHSFLQVCCWLMVNNGTKLLYKCCCVYMTGLQTRLHVTSSFMSPCIYI